MHSPSSPNRHPRLVAAVQILLLAAVFHGIVATSPNVPHDRGGAAVAAPAAGFAAAVV